MHRAKTLPPFLPALTLVFCMLTWIEIPSWVHRTDDLKLQLSIVCFRIEYNLSVFTAIHAHPSRSPVASPGKKSFVVVTSERNRPSVCIFSDILQMNGVDS